MKALKKRATERVESRSLKKIQQEQEEFRAHLAAIETEKKRKRLQRLEDRTVQRVQSPQKTPPPSVPRSQICTVSGGTTAFITVTKSQFSVIKFPTNLNSILRFVPTSNHEMKGAERILFDSD